MFSVHLHHFPFSLVTPLSLPPLPLPILFTCHRHRPDVLSSPAPLPLLTSQPPLSPPPPYSLPVTGTVQMFSVHLHHFPFSPVTPSLSPLSPSPYSLPVTGTVQMFSVHLHHFPFSPVTPSLSPLSPSPYSLPVTGTVQMFSVHLHHFPFSPVTPSLSPLSPSPYSLPVIGTVQMFSVHLHHFPSHQSPPLSTPSPYSLPVAGTVQMFTVTAAAKDVAFLSVHIIVLAAAQDVRISTASAKHIYKAKATKTISQLAFPNGGVFFHYYHTFLLTKIIQGIGGTIII